MKKSLAIVLACTLAFVFAACSAPAASSAPASSAPAASSAASSEAAIDPAVVEKNTATVKSAVEKMLTLPNEEIAAAGEGIADVVKAQYADEFSDKGIESAIGKNAWKDHVTAAENKASAAPTDVQITNTDERHFLYTATVTVTLADGTTQDVTAKGNVQLDEDGKINYFKPVRTVLQDVTFGE